MSVHNGIQMEGVEQKLRKAVELGAVRAAASVQATAVDRAPFRTGALRGSSPPPEAEWIGSTVRAVVAFNVVYAARQHEETGWAHTLGQAKFLQSALNDQQDQVRTILANHLKGIL